MNNKPEITVVVPSFNHAEFLDKALLSIFAHNLNLEVFVMDGGSTDGTLDVIKKWKDKLAGWRSAEDNGQSVAINEGTSLGSAEYVCWLNSDDWLLPNGLSLLKDYLDKHPDCPAAYGKVWNYNQNTNKKKPVWVEPFSEKRLALRCIISQPATLIRRSVWEDLGGLDCFFRYGYGL